MITKKDITLFIAIVVAVITIDWTFFNTLDKIENRLQQDLSVLQAEHNRIIIDTKVMEAKLYEKSGLSWEGKVK